jgi:hypothetical protein
MKKKVLSEDSDLLVPQTQRPQKPMEQDKCKERAHKRKKISLLLKQRNPN